MSNDPCHSGERQLCLVDGFELRDGATVVPVCHSAQRLIAFLALEPRPVLRTYVSGSLWTDSQSARASASLRSALWRCTAPGGAPVILATSTHLRLHPSIEVDFLQTVSWMKAMLADTSLVDPDRSVTLDRDLLPDWYDDWVMLERERFRQLRLHALELQCHRLAALGRFGEAVNAGLAAVAIEPLRESAHREVIMVHLLERNTVEAIRQYRRYEQLLAVELSLQPSAQLSQLMRPCLSGDDAVTLGRR
jgi:DNA-binding SARP family transcriptional activator